MSKTKLLMIRDGGCLRPYGDVAWDDFDNIRTKKPIVVTVHQARNPEHHGKLFAILKKVAENDPDFIDAEDVLIWIKVQLRMIRGTRDARGRQVLILESIDFESMDQLRFNRFYDRAMWLLSQRLGVDAETLGKEAQQEAA